MFGSRLFTDGGIVIRNRNVQESFNLKQRLKHLQQEEEDVKWQLKRQRKHVVESSRSIRLTSGRSPQARSFSGMSIGARPSSVTVGSDIKSSSQSRGTSRSPRQEGPMPSGQSSLLLSKHFRKPWALSFSETSFNAMYNDDFDPYKCRRARRVVHRQPRVIRGSSSVSADMSYDRQRNGTARPVTTFRAFRQSASRSEKVDRRSNSDTSSKHSDHTEVTKTTYIQKNVVVLHSSTSASERHKDDSVAESPSKDISPGVSNFTASVENDQNSTDVDNVFGRPSKRNQRPKTAFRSSSQQTSPSGSPMENPPQKERCVQSNTCDKPSYLTDDEVMNNDIPEDGNNICTNVAASGDCTDLEKRLSGGLKKVVENSTTTQDKIEDEEEDVIRAHSTEPKEDQPNKFEEPLPDNNILDLTLSDPKNGTTNEKTNEDNYVIFKGKKIHNYVRPQDRYKRDVFKEARYGQLMQRLSPKNPIKLNESRVTDVRIDLVFPRAARAIALRRLVEENRVEMARRRHTVVGDTDLERRVKEFCQPRV